jgi:4-hydroxybenzoate polyprenyltransferase
MFRLPNLVMVFLTQYIPYWFVLRPALLKAGAIPALTERSFGLIAAATLLTTFAGYVINDYYDRHIDAFNKPHRLFYGRFVSPNVALYLYGALVVAVHAIAFLLDREMPMAGRWTLWVYPAVSFLLFLYAWQLKCTPILGNLSVSLLCGIVPVILIFPENRPIWLASFRQPDAIQQAVSLVWLYGLFAFITNLLREQVKDLEDYRGDAACGCNTLAVQRGPRFAKKPAGFTGLTASVLIGLLIYFWYETGAPAWRLAGGILLLFMPALFTTAVVYRAETKQAYSRASMYIKILMFAGLFLLLP